MCLRDVKRKIKLMSWVPPTTFQFSIYRHYGNYCLQIVYIILGWFLFLFFFSLDLYKGDSKWCSEAKSSNKDLQSQGVKIPHSESFAAQVCLEVVFILKRGSEWKAITYFGFGQHCRKFSALSNWRRRCLPTVQAAAAAAKLGQPHTPPAARAQPLQYLLDSSGLYQS